MAREWTEDEWEQALEQLRTEGTVDAHGVRFDAASVKRLLGAAPRVDDRPHFTSATFTLAIFGDGTSFVGATFGDGISFVGAAFGNGASFNGVTFGNKASFDQATFGNWVGFHEATFGNEASFYDATFGDIASFAGATFGDGANFDRAIFGNGANFGPLLVTGRLTVDGVTLPRPFRVEISAAEVSAQRMVIPFGATFLLRWAELNLENSQVLQPTIVAALEPPADPRLELTIARDPETGRPDPRWLHPDTGELDPRPRLVSLRLVNVENLVLSDVNLAACRFRGVHNLDRLRWEGSTEFAPVPRVGPIWWGSRRQALAAEHKWRAARRHSKGWYPPGCRPREESVRDAEPLEPTKTATLYRALRKAREDAKDEPGAADFYYGEMEMRRFAAAWGAERLLLTVYWLSCGYALRAWRAFAWLTALLLIGAFLFATVGFDRSPMRASQPDRLMPSGQLHYPTVTPSHTTGVDGLEFAVDTSTSLLHTPSDRPLTGSGRVIELALRFAGPLLLGLALISLRGRLKR